MIDAMLGVEQPSEEATVRARELLVEAAKQTQRDNRLARVTCFSDRGVDIGEPVQQGGVRVLLRAELVELVGRCDAVVLDPFLEAGWAHRAEGMHPERLGPAMLAVCKDPRGCLARPAIAQAANGHDDRGTGGIPLALQQGTACASGTCSTTSPKSS